MNVSLRRQQARSCLCVTTGIGQQRPCETPTPQTQYTRKNREDQALGAALLVLMIHDPVLTLPIWYAYRIQHVSQSRPRVSFLFLECRLRDSSSQYELTKQMDH